MRSVRRRRGAWVHSTAIPPRSDCVAPLCTPSPEPNGGSGFERQPSHISGPVVTPYSAARPRAAGRLASLAGDLAELLPKRLGSDRTPGGDLVMRPLRNSASARAVAGATAAVVLASCVAALTMSGDASASGTASRTRSVAAGSRTAVVTDATSGGTFVTPPGIRKIKHVIVIMQENRSFDSYFGTFPGADGIPAANGQFTVCVPDPVTKGCDKPYNNPSDTDLGGCHGSSCIPTVEDGGKMDGFVASAEQFAYPTDVMGYEDAREIPNYWAYAEHYTLD